jgi:hypothetical protein
MKKLLVFAIIIFLSSLTACGDDDKDKTKDPTPTSQPVTIQQDSPENTARSYMQAYASKNADGINSILCNNDPSSELWAETSMWDGVGTIQIEDAEYTVLEQSTIAARVSFRGNIVTVSDGDESEAPVMMYFQLRFLNDTWCVAEN